MEGLVVKIGGHLGFPDYTKGVRGGGVRRETVDVEREDRVKRST
jgi:hypothetical protein